MLYSLSEKGRRRPPLAGKSLERLLRLLLREKKRNRNDEPDKEKNPNPSLERNARGSNAQKDEESSGRGGGDSLGVNLWRKGLDPHLRTKGGRSERGSLSREKPEKTASIEARKEEKGKRSTLASWGEGREASQCAMS